MYVFLSRILKRIYYYNSTKINKLTPHRTKINLMALTHKYLQSLKYNYGLTMQAFFTRHRLSKCNILIFKSIPLSDVDSPILHFHCTQ